MSKLVLGLVLLAICLSCFCSLGASKRLEARISEQKNFIFLSKFIVAGKGAQMVFEASDIEPKKDSEDKKMELDLYNGEKGKKWYWNDVWDDDDSSSNCDKKQGDQHSLSNTAYINGTKWDFPFNEKDPLEWYIAASDCSLGKNDKFQMTVNIHWTNPGSGWYKEFSLEEQDLLTLYLVFTIFWIFFIPVHIVGMIKFRSRKDSTDWGAFIFNTIITLYFIALWMYLIHYAVYASDGVGVPGFLIAADIFDMFQTVLVFVLLVMLASKASHPLDMHWGKVGALAVMLLIYMSFFIWQEVYAGVDMEFFSYKWETPPGIVMLIFLSFVWVTFVGSGAYSIWQEKEGAMNRKIFFSVFLGIFSVWFLALPFMATVMAGAPFYYRWKAVLGVVLTVNLFTYAFMSQMLLDTPVSRLFRGTKAETKNAAAQDLLDKEDDYTPYGTL